MRDRWVLLGIAVVVATVASSRALASSAPAVAAPASSVRAVAAPALPAPAVAPIALPSPAEALPIVTTRDSSAASELTLRRAAAAQRLGDARGVVALLEPVDFATEPSFAGADRAAFLLGRAYLTLGSRDRFDALARAVAQWTHRSAWTEWLAYQLAIGGAAVDPRGALARLADLELAGSPALTRLARDGAAHADSDAVTRDLVALSALDTTTALNRDLAGAALIRRATRTLARGEDAAPLLEQVSRRSRFASRAQHMLGLIELERGNTVQGRATLGALLADDWSYPAQRSVMTALAGQALDAGEWAAARRLYERAEGDWREEGDSLRSLISNMEYGPVWAAWESGAQASQALVPDPAMARRWTDQLTRAAIDFSVVPPAGAPAFDAMPPTAGGRWPLPPPAPEAWSELAASARRVGEAEDALGRADAGMAAIRRAVAERTHYLEFGFGQVHRQTTQLEQLLERLDALKRQLASLDASLRGVRDAASRHLVARATAMLEQAATQLCWMRAMRHFDLDGPHRERPLVVPPGLPSPDSLLTAEEALTRTVAASIESLAAQSPALIRRSYELAWRPGIIERATTEDAEAGRALAWARRIGASVDSSLALGLPDSLVRLEARAAALARTADSLRVAHAALRDRIAHGAVERALAGLGAEREGLDYGLAASAYGLSVGLDRADSSQVMAAASDTSATAGDDAELRRWRTVAITALEQFLDRHPQSFARGEMRFRLADLEMVAARRTFREQMAHFIREQSAGGTAAAIVPTVDSRPALELYRTILAEDTGFAHLDAVLFNAGMLLADDADPGATPMFQRLVADYPASRYCQEAYVRMGDVGFNDHRYTDCIPYYQQAARGADSTLCAIALYKLGWAEFSLDRFLDAADAFRSILDLYADPASHGTRGRLETKVNLADEAEAYLVHTLARAGGADAFASYFDRVGPRPYETRLLRELAQHFRRYSLYAEAAATDRLLIARHPLDQDALLSAQRMIETYQRWDRPALARAARLEYAPRFAPGSDWAAAQTSDSTRVAGSTFARAAWITVAREHHRTARETGSRAEYGQALELYETVLSKWPDNADSPALELQAGETSAQVGDYARALAHYGAAAKAGPDSVAAPAMWQRVAVTDAWYASTRGSARNGGATPGADTLAKAVIAAADDMLARYPDDPRAVDLMWRQGNLAFAHGWYERAAGDFGLLATRHGRDSRAPAAASLRADALFRLGHFGDAGAAYEQALAAARHAGTDSLARRAEAAIPVSYYREAEAAVAADSTAYAKHAQLFEQVAARWPGYEHADLARYRAGLAYQKAGSTHDAVRMMQSLVADFPGSEFVRDAVLEIATLNESQGDHERAASAYAEFAGRFPADAQAGPAMLKAADLFAQSDRTPSADTLRLEYIRRHPADVETAMTLLEEMARRELATVGAERPISTLLPAARPAAPKRKKGAGAAPAVPAGPPASRLADYLARAETHPALASKTLLAQVRFLQGEETYAGYVAATLSQPLNKSIPIKQKLLDGTLARYRQAIDFGDSEWAHASTYRIGQALVAFGDALEQSERPADLKGDDLAAYDDVLAKQANAFYSRGEDVWAELLRQKQREAPEESWIRAAQSSLWQRLGGRFRYRTEAVVPLVEGTPPASAPADSTRPRATSSRVRPGQHDADTRAQQEEDGR